MSDNKSEHGEFCWSELITPDAKAAKTFYSALFGWEIEEHDMGESTYTILKKGDTQVGGLMQTPKGKENQIPPHWGNYVNVDNLEATLEHVKSLGGKVASDIAHAGNFGRFAVIQDPTGAYISLWESVAAK